ncbi:Crp/Fnr family transcriptional regulator [Anaerospora hongkongensis]|uniref:Crp/Fnr family transcriptional regulator n=1 Tax=Anaerospora hongkongensis TaxID=244830 RepID=UPI002897D0C2|nr:Crp/Fnr family transcriptional regulator [Anaerospora hongkongensis]
MDFIQQLKKMPVFADLPDAQLKDLYQITTERKYRKGSVIFLEGEQGEGFHYLQSGKVKIVKMTDDGREHIINILSPGDLFAEVLLFNNRDYPATAIAVEESKVGVIKNTDLERLILGNNLLALQLIKALSQRLLFAQQKIKNLALHDVTARTAETLLRLGTEHGRILTNGQIEITLDLSRQDLASLVGTTRETVTRTLSSLKKDKIIDFDIHKITIIEPNKLKRLFQ